MPPRQQRQLESLVSETTGQPIARTTPADPLGYGLGVVQQYVSQPIGTVWTYEGETFGYRVLHVYYPCSGIIIALAVNSADSLPDTWNTRHITADGLERTFGVDHLAPFLQHPGNGAASTDCNEAITPTGQNNHYARSSTHS